MYGLASSATHHLMVQHEGTGPLLLTRGGAYAEYPEGVRRSADLAAAARLSGAGHPCMRSRKGMETMQRRASQRPYIRNGRVGNDTGWPCRLGQDHE
jgi:hypothetical protein